MRLGEGRDFLRLLNMGANNKNHNNFTSFLYLKVCGMIRGGPRLSEISYNDDPPIYDITSGCRVSALFLREAPRWTPMLFGFFVILTHRLMELSILNPKCVEKVYSRPFKQMS